MWVVVVPLVTNAGYIGETTVSAGDGVRDGSPPFVGDLARSKGDKVTPGYIVVDLRDVGNE